MKTLKSLFILIDVLSILFINLIFQIKIYPNFLLVIILWIFINYLSNKYKLFGSNLRKNLIDITKTSFLSFFILSIFIFIFDLSESTSDITEIYYFFIYNSIIGILFRLIFEVIKNFFEAYPKSFFLLNKKSNLHYYSNFNFFDNAISELIIINSINEIFNKIKNFKKNKIILITDFHLLSDTDLTKLKEYNIELIDKKKWFENNEKKLIPEEINKENLNLKDVKKIFYKKYIKRFADVSISLIILILSTPILLLAAFFIFIEDGGSILYFQKRTGYKNKIINIIKLRSMSINSELDGAKWAKSNDKRITSIGKILRLTRIDELPQLINVLKGEMSLIGPRPERPEIDLNLINEIENYNFRYLIKPGISGWAQVCYPYAASIEDTYQKLSYDFFYIKNQSIFLDLYIFIRTIKVIFNIKGSKPIG